MDSSELNIPLKEVESLFTLQRLDFAVYKLS